MDSETTRQGSYAYPMQYRMVLCSYIVGNLIQILESRIDSVGMESEVQARLQS